MGGVDAAEAPAAKRRKRVEKVPQWERGVRRFTEQKRSISALPVIAQDGAVVRATAAVPKFRVRGEVGVAKGGDVEEEEVNEEDEEVEVEENDEIGSGDRKRKRDKGLESFAVELEAFEVTKANIAAVASKVVADPQGKVGLLRELRDLAFRYKGREAVLVILTESMLYKDIAPAYRIRNISEKEAEIKVSKEVAQLREFEETFLGHYQRFVKSVASVSRWRSGKTRDSQASRGMAKVRRAACTALSELARALPHFNEAESVMAAVTALVTDRDAGVRRESSNALRSVLSDAHRASGATLSVCTLIAKSLAKIAANKASAVPAEAVEPLVAIRFANFARLPKSKKAANARKTSQRFNKKYRRKPQASEADKDAAREEWELERDLQEGDAAATPTELYGAKKNMLDAVCHAYFNVILSAGQIAEIRTEKEKKGKTNNRTRARKAPPALTASLDGMLRIATFIGSDVIEAILAALTPLLEAERLPLGTRFQCLSAAYAVLGVHSRAQRADPDSFTGDARAMDTCLYAALGNLYGGHTADGAEEDITYDALQAVIASSTHRIVPPRRSAAIARRMALMAASVAPTHGCAVGLLSVAQVLLPPALVSCVFPGKHGMEESGVASEGGLVQDFDMVTDDPDIAGAESSAAWELAATCAHFHPAVRAVSSRCAGGRCGARLPKQTADLVHMARMYSSEEGGFNPPPQPSHASAGQKRAHARRPWASLEDDEVLKTCIPRDEERSKYVLSDEKLPDLSRKWRTARIVELHASYVAEQARNHEEAENAAVQSKRAKKQRYGKQQHQLAALKTLEPAKRERNKKKRRAGAE